MITEADTCRKYVLPKLYSSGWCDDQISEQKTFTDGRIVVAGEKCIRKKLKRADILLKYRRDFSIGVVEAKSAYKNAGDGLQQAKEYAEILGLKFAYSTNGKRIVEHDFITGKDTDLENFPEDKQTAETALLFLQLIMRKLRRGAGGKRGGRCGIVVPNGTLFGDGVCARIKKELLEKFNLHTIVRLPNGVFAPYTGIPTNLLFFERDGPTKEVWYHEVPLPESRKQYTKTQPMQFEEFVPVVAYWKERKENEHAWKVSAAKEVEGGYNLDIKNPNGKQDLEHLPPEQLTESILKKEQRIAEIMAEIKQVLTDGMKQ